MSVASKRKYSVTFILDLRGYDEPVENLIEYLKTTLTELNAEVASIENQGIKEFAQVPDQRFTSGHYLRAEVEAEPDLNVELTEKLRLDRRIHRIFCERKDA
jgi:ribosomal protein S6